MPSKKKPSASRCAAILEDDSELDDDKANLVDDSAPAYAALQLGTTHAHRAPAAGVTQLRHNIELVSYLVQRLPLGLRLAIFGGLGSFLLIFFVIFAAGLHQFQAQAQSPQPHRSSSHTTVPDVSAVAQQRPADAASHPQQYAHSHGQAPSDDALVLNSVEFIEIDNRPFFEATAPVRAKYGAQYADLMKRIAAVR